MVVFENPGKENAEKALRIGIAKAAEIGAPAVVSLGGSSFGVDTAAVITPGYSADILDTRVHEVLCKPGLYEL